MSVVRMRVREIRESLDPPMTQAELARRVGIRPSHLLEIEKHRTGGIDFGILGRLAKALGVHPGDLFTVQRSGSK